MENNKIAVFTDYIFHHENIIKVKLFVYVGLSFFLTYIFAKKFYELTQNEASKLKIYDRLKERIRLVWALLKSILGDTIAVQHIILDYLSNLKDTPRDISIWFLHFVYIDNPDDLEAVLNSSNTLKKSGVYKFFKQIIGEGLITASVPQWKKMRRLAAPMFTAKFVEKSVPIFNNHGSVLVKKLQNCSDTNEYFDLWNLISKTTLAIIFDVIMGAEFDISENEREILSEASSKATEAIGHRIKNIWLFPSFIFDIYCFIKGYQKYIITLAETLPKKVRFLEHCGKSEALGFGVRGKISAELGNLVVLTYKDALFKQKEMDLEVQITDKEIIDEGKTILAGGSETNALTVSFTLIMLAMHPQIQEKVYREIIEFSGEDDTDLNFQQIHKMAFLEQCVKETMRLFSPVPFILRKATNNFKLNDNFTVKKNSNVIIPIFMVHRNPNIYPNPTKWDPDNFLPNKVESRHRYSFLPFSGGARGCIGAKFAMMAIKIVLTKILKNYRLDVDYTIDDIKLGFDMVIRSINGYNIKMYSRSKN